MSSDESVFGATSHADWAEMVAKLLGGVSAESLNRIDEDGLAVSALYEIDPVVRPEARLALQLPQAPADRVRYGWDICQPIRLTDLHHTALAAANSSILAALETGANSLWLSSKEDITAVLPALFDQVFLPAIRIIIDAPTSSDLPQLLQTLAGDKAISLHFANSPLSQSGLAAGLELANDPILTGIFIVDGWILHNQGHTNIAELAAVLAGVATILRAGHESGHDLTALTSRISLTLAMPADTFDGIAKLRAMRQLLTSLFAGLALNQTGLPRLIGRPSLRMMSLLYPEENILRTTTALLGGAIGGADAMAALGYDYLSGESEAARRLARLTQLIMIEESGLARSLDPASGSAFIENRTDDLASAAWKQFQTIEAQGGLPVFAETGLLAAWADAANAKREAALRAGKTQLVGVTLQPAPDDPASLAAIPENPVRPSALVEVIRQEALAASPRILVLRAESTDTAESKQEQAVIKLLAIAGLHPLVLSCGSDQDAALAAARPDIVISCLNSDEIAVDARSLECLIVDARDLLADADQLGRVRALISGVAA